MTTKSSKSKLVGFMGAPGTGKTILACALKEYFMLKKVSTDICTEYAREFCFKYGIPKHPYTSYRISSQQFEKEDVLLKGTDEYVFTDSPVWLGYIYSLAHTHAGQDAEIRSFLTDMYHKCIIEQMDRYHVVFHLKNDMPYDDGCRDMEENKKIADVIEGFVLSHKHTLPIVDVDIPVEKATERKDFVWETLKEYKKK